MLLLLQGTTTTTVCLINSNIVSWLLLLQCQWTITITITITILRERWWWTDKSTISHLSTKIQERHCNYSATRSREDALFYTVKLVLRVIQLVERKQSSVSVFAGIWDGVSLRWWLSDEQGLLVREMIESHLFEINSLLSFYVNDPRFLKWESQEKKMLGFEFLVQQANFSKKLLLTMFLFCLHGFM